MSEYFTLGDKKFIPEAGASGNLYRVLTDRELGRSNRNRLPMVFWLSNETMPCSQDWQYFIRAINYGMSLQHVAALFDSWKFAFNNMGFGDPSDPRRNYITGDNLDAPADPYFSKVYTCGMSIVEIINGVVTTMDGRYPPFLMPWVSRPRTIQEATPGRYFYNPRTHPHLFYACVNSVNGDPVPFANGALYPWYKGGREIVTWMPYVSDKVITWPVPGPQQRENTARLVKI